MRGTCIGYASMKNKERAKKEKEENSRLNELEGQLCEATSNKDTINAFKEALERGYLSTTKRRGVISLIPKPQKDPDDHKNWRLITLLNQDYKWQTE